MFRMNAKGGMDEDLFECIQTNTAPLYHEHGKLVLFKLRRKNMNLLAMLVKNRFILCPWLLNTTHAT